MTDRFVIGGLDLTALGICDVSRETFSGLTAESFGEELMRQLLGSITFGPLVLLESEVPNDANVQFTDEDFGWEYAE
jgi:hypothetical protein